MSSPCSRPLSVEACVAYAAGDLSAADESRVEEHFIACASCTALLSRVTSVTNAIGSLLPPVLRPGDLPGLRARGLRLEDNVMQPGETKEGVLGPHLDALLHRLSGLALADADRVDVVIRSQSAGTLLAVPAAPFDPAADEVIVACQSHFRDFPPDVVIDVRVVKKSGAKVSSYTIPHRFVGADA